MTIGKNLTKTKLSYKTWMIKILLETFFFCKDEFHVKNKIEQFAGKTHLILKVSHMRENISYEILDKDFMHKQVISCEKSFSN